MDAMHRRTIAILVLVAIAVQAAFGGVSGGVDICLGGGHEHSQGEIAAECAIACEHETGLPTPAPTDDHDDDDCGCIDIELTIVDLLARGRDVFDEAELPAPTLALFSLININSGNAWWRGPPQSHCSDPGGTHRLAALRTTRLIV